MFKKGFICLCLLCIAIVGCSDVDETEAKFTLSTNVSGTVFKEDRFKAVSIDIQDILGIIYDSNSSNEATFSDKQKASMQVYCRAGANALRFTIKLDGFDSKWYQAGSADDIEGKKLEAEMIKVLRDWVREQYNSMPSNGTWKYKNENRSANMDIF